MIVVCLATLIVPFRISDELGMAVMLSVGWLAVTGVIFCGPILVWSVLEAVVDALIDRVYPRVDQLGLSPRVGHILERHGYRAIRDVAGESDAALLLLSNMDQRDVREVRRAINLWKYARWQERGFPAIGHD